MTVHSSGRTDIDSQQFDFDLEEDGSGYVEIGREGPLHYEIIGFPLTKKEVDRLRAYMNGNK